MAIIHKQSFIDALASYCGLFEIQLSTEKDKPTAGDYSRTLDDLEQVTSDFIDRLGKLAGHEIEGLIDNAWYSTTKQLPDADEREQMKRLALNFRQQVRIAQTQLPTMVETKGRTKSTEPIRDLVNNCRCVLSSNGASDEEVEVHYRRVVKICLNATGNSHMLDRLRHYL